MVKIDRMQLYLKTEIKLRCIKFIITQGVKNSITVSLQLKETHLTFNNMQKKPTTTTKNKTTCTANYLKNTYRNYTILLNFE